MSSPPASVIGRTVYFASPMVDGGWHISDHKGDRGVIRDQKTFGTVIKFYVQWDDGIKGWYLPQYISFEPPAPT